MNSRCLCMMSTDSFHRRGAVSSRRGPADRWGSLVPPGRIRGRTGRWSEPLAPAQCGTSSSSRSGSRAGLDRSHFGTPLRKRKERRKEKGWWMDALRRCYCLWRGVSTGDVSRRSRRSCGSRREQDKQHDTWFRHDAGTYSLRGGIRPPKDWWTYCALTWPRDRMMDLRWTVFKYHPAAYTDSLPPKLPCGRASRFNSRLPLKRSWVRWSQAVSCHSRWFWSATRKGVLCCCVGDCKRDSSLDDQMFVFLYLLWQSVQVNDPGWEFNTQVRWSQPSKLHRWRRQVRLSFLTSFNESSLEEWRDVVYGCN